MINKIIFYFVFFLLFSLILLSENFTLAQQQPQIVLIGQVTFSSKQAEKDAAVTIIAGNTTETVISDKVTGFFKKGLYNVEEGNNFIKLYAEKDGIKSPEEVVFVYFVPNAVSTITVSNIVLKIPNVSPNGQEEPILLPERCKKDPDFNGDGKVDLIDFSIMLYYWNSTEFCQADLDNDGVVGISDVSSLLFFWNQ